jgi:preprotein translocase subunit YajC
MLQGQPTNLLSALFPFLAIIIIFYFLLIRPQKKMEKERQNMLQSLDKNDEIVTSSGIHGVVVNLKEKTIILRIDDNVKIEIDKSCIAYIKKKQV